MSDDLSEYERRRLEHIKRNHEMLVRLGLEKPLVEKKATPKGQKRVRAAPVMPETLRRSGRVRGAAVEYDKEVIDKHGDDMDKQCAAKPGRKRERKEDGEDNDADDDEAARAEMLESTTAFLRAARAALLRFATSADGEAPTTDAAWREEALRRWGDLVGGGGGETRDWEVYVTSRLSTPPPPSPLDLLQEYYAADQWQLLCCCVLMSRCSSWDTKHRCISGFFAAYPTPSAFLEKAGPCPSPSLSPSPNFCSCPCPSPSPSPSPGLSPNQALTPVQPGAGGQGGGRGLVQGDRSLAGPLRRPAQGNHRNHAGLPCPNPNLTPNPDPNPDPDPDPNTGLPARRRRVRCRPGRE